MSRGAVDSLVHEQEVADEQGSLHGFGRDAERLHDEGEDEEGDDEEGEEGAESFEGSGVEDVVVSCGGRGGGLGIRNCLRLVTQSDDPLSG
jgi:hypothetical protein